MPKSIEQVQSISREPQLDVLSTAVSGYLFMNVSQAYLGVKPHPPEGQCEHVYLLLSSLGTEMVCACFAVLPKISSLREGKGANEGSLHTQEKAYTWKSLLGYFTGSIGPS